MKYNKEFKHLLVTDECISHITNPKPVVLSYDKWKQRIKRPTVHFILNWRLLLFKECKSIDSMIFARQTPLKMMCSFGHPSLSDSQKVRLSELNKKTLYKVCKKIDKRLLGKGSNQARDWYVKAVTDHQFRFLGSKELTQLKLSLGILEPDCPVCLETLPALEVEATRCGHILCSACSRSIKEKSCPICRAPL